MEDPRLANYSEEIRVDFKSRDKTIITPLVIPTKTCSPAVSHHQPTTINRGVIANGDKEDNISTGRQQSEVQMVSSMSQLPSANTEITSTSLGFESRVEIEPQTDSSIGSRNTKSDSNTWSDRTRPTGNDRVGGNGNSQLQPVKEVGFRGNITLGDPQAQIKETMYTNNPAQSLTTKPNENIESISNQSISGIQEINPLSTAITQNFSSSYNESESGDSCNITNSEDLNKARKKKHGQWKRDARKRKEISSQEAVGEEEFIAGRKRIPSPMDIDQVNSKSRTKLSVINFEEMGVVAALNQPQAQC